MQYFKSQLNTFGQNSSHAIQYSVDSIYFTELKATKMGNLMTHGQLLLGNMM